MPQALYQKWRSQTFEEVVGQEHVTQTMRNALRENRVAHAYLFSGPRGTGKTSTARILAKALNCTGPEENRPCNTCPTCVAINEGRMIDLIEIDAASNNSVEDVRELREKVSFRPSEGQYKIYIIDEVHMLSASAFNALLKTLEEPPPHARFILATTEPHKIPATVLSRCQRFDFRRIPTAQIATHLRHIMDAEGYHYEDEALIAVGQSAQGCMRDAISLLDQMISYGSETVTLEQVQQVLGAVSAQVVVDFIDSLADKDIASGLKIIQQLTLDGSSLTEFAAQIVEHLRGVLLLQMTGDADLLSEWPNDTVDAMRRQAGGMEQADTLFAVKRFSEAAVQLKGGYQPQLPLELAFIEAVRGGPAPSPPQLVEDAPSVAKAAAAPAMKPTERTRPEEAAPDVTAPAPERVPAPLDESAAEALKDQWKDFLGTMRSRCGHEVQAALRTVCDVAISENTVAFAFGKNEFTRKMVERPETLKAVAAALSDLLGRQMNVECQIGDKAQLHNRIGAAERTEENGPDPLVEYAIEELGAEIVDSSQD